MADWKLAVAGKPVFRAIVDAWALYDGTLTPPKLIEWSHYEYERHSIIP